MNVTMSETNKEEANNYMCTSDSDEEMYQQNSTYNTSTNNKQYQLQLYMIGTRIIKEFKGVYFEGQVAGFHYPYYRIVYCDGDGEDLNPGEVRKMLKPKVKAKLKNEKNVTLRLFKETSLNGSIVGENDNEWFGNAFPFTKQDHRSVITFQNIGPQPRYSTCDKARATAAVPSHIRP